ncbi:unnamed protein product, partial [Arabidopsis halleri]
GLDVDTFLIIVFFLYLFSFKSIPILSSSIYMSNPFQF